MVDIYQATNRPGKCPPLAVDANYINPRGQLTRPSETGTKILGFLYWNALVNI